MNFDLDSKLSLESFGNKAEVRIGGVGSEAMINIHANAGSVLP